MTTSIAIARGSGPGVSMLEDHLETLLLGHRSEGVMPFLDSILEKTVPHPQEEYAGNDIILTHLLNYPFANPPIFNNTYCAEIGRLLERMVADIFVHSRPPGDVEHGSALNSRLKFTYDADPAYRRPAPGKRAAVKFKAADLSIRQQIVEVKYRFNSYQNMQCQIQVAHVYRRMGYRPVFLHITPDFTHLDQFQKAGWEVHVGQDATDWITENSGVDFPALLESLGSRPEVIARTTRGYDRVRQRQVDTWRYHLDNCDFPIRDGIYSCIAADNAHFGAILKQRAGLTEADFDDIRLRTHEEFEIVRNSTLDKGIDEICGVFERIDNDNKTEALSRLLDTLDDAQIREVLARHS